MIQTAVNFVSQNHRVVILMMAFACLIVVGLIGAVKRNYWRELREALDLVRCNPPVERNDKTYGHQLVWQGPYYEVVFQLDDGRIWSQKGTITFHSDGHEKGWRVIGPLWSLRVDKGNPNVFYWHDKIDKPIPIPRAMRATFDALVQAVRQQTAQYA